jgi:alkaline phosphatase
MRSKRIPITAAKHIAKEYEYTEVVIFARDHETGNQYITSYGKTKKDCKSAANAGNHLKKALGWVEKLWHPNQSLLTKLEINGVTYTIEEIENMVSMAENLGLSDV